MPSAIAFDIDGVFKYGREWSEDGHRRPPIHYEGRFKVRNSATGAVRGKTTAELEIL